MESNSLNSSELFSFSLSVLSGSLVSTTKEILDNPIVKARRICSALPGLQIDRVVTMADRGDSRISIDGVISGAKRKLHWSSPKAWLHVGLSFSRPITLEVSVPRLNRGDGRSEIFPLYRTSFYIQHMNHILLH